MQKSENSAPAAKRQRKCSEDDNDDAYNENVDKLRDLLSSAKRPKKEIKSLMKATRSCRQRWIVQECPETQAVLDKFPFLKKTKYVSLIIL